MVLELAATAHRSGGQTDAAEPTPHVSEKAAHANVAACAGDAPAEQPTGQPAERAAWALMLRSPYQQNRAATSWLGGLPHAPKAFCWPRGADGAPLPFFAQIDLSTLKPEPTTGARPPGLPSDGALLIFVGDSCAIKWITAVEVALGQPLAPPADLPNVCALRTSNEGGGIPAWPIDAVPYLSCGDARPDFSPPPFATPSAWIVNWEIAELEAALVIDALERELNDHRNFVEQRRTSRSLKKKGLDWLFDATPQEVKERLEHHAVAEANYPPLMRTLEDWRDRALEARPDAPVDAAALDTLFAERIALSQRMLRDYGARRALRGDAESVWKATIRHLPKRGGASDFSAVPRALRSFVTMKITDWRGHRLFGLAPTAPCASELRRDDTSFLAISADPLIDVASDHGFRLAFASTGEELASGAQAEGRVIQYDDR